MINHVVLVGRLTRAVELRYTSQNKAVGSFNLAVNRNFKNQNGEREADFIQCIIWQKSAENLSTWCKKGDLIGVVGRLQTRHYENARGKRVYVTEVFVEQFQVLENKGSRTNEESLRNSYQESLQEEQTSFFQGQTTNLADDEEKR